MKIKAEQDLDKNIVLLFSIVKGVLKGVLNPNLHKQNMLPREQRCSAPSLLCSNPSSCLPKKPELQRSIDSKLSGRRGL